jgi:hypothetical protein
MSLAGLSAHRTIRTLDTVRCGACKGSLLVMHEVAIAMSRHVAADLAISCRGRPRSGHRPPPLAHCPPSRLNDEGKAMAARIRHIALSVKDIDATADF